MKKIAPAVWALIGALVLGGFARSWDLTAHSLFIDEGFTFLISGKPWPEMMNQIVYHDFHPPLFYVVTHYAMAWLHWDLWNYRYFTAPFGLVTIAATWAIARRLFGDVAAGVAAVLIAVEPSLIEWDRLYRMYSVMTALSAVSWWLLLAAPEKRGRMRWAFWGMYAAVSIVQPYIQYLAALNVFCQGLYAFSAVLRDREKLRALWPVFASGFAAVVALLPWLPAFRIQYPNGGHVAGSAELPIYWIGIVRDAMLSGAPIAWVQQPWFDPAASAAVVLLAVYAVVRASRTVLPWWFAVAGLQVALSLATHKSLVVPRYMEHVVPAVMIAIGGAVDSLLRTRLRAAALIIGIAVPATLAVCTADVLWYPFYQFPDWYLINLVVLQHEQKNDAMLFVQGFPYIVVGDFTAFRGRPVAGPAMPSDLPYTLRWIDRHARQRIWYIENQYFYPDPQKKIKAYLDKTRSTLAEYSEARSNAGDVVNVILYSEAHMAPKRHPPGKRNATAPSSRVPRITSATSGLER